MAKQLTVIDYGMANLLNVTRAFKHCGAEVEIIDTPRSVITAERLVVPGVGAFKDCMNGVITRKFDDAIYNFVATGRPVLGICVGMQILFDISEEFGEHSGLSIIPGRVRMIPNMTVSGISQRLPHIGWNHLVPTTKNRSWKDSVLNTFERQNPALYFIHSFAANPENEEDCLADCIYGGHRVCAAIQRENLVATQFHPERSGKIGLSILQNFLDI